MKPNSGKPTIRQRIMAGDWHDKTVAEIAEELGCSRSSVCYAMQEIEAYTGEPVPHKSGVQRKTLIINGKEYTIIEALLASDWSDLRTAEIAEVLGVEKGDVLNALCNYRNRTGREIPYAKGKHKPKTR